MAIMVHYKDNTVSFVPDRELGDLILSDRIVAFRRGSEWVTLAVANIRHHAGPARNSGREKRGASARGDVWKRVFVSDAL